jgi:hypothetical protein
MEAQAQATEMTLNTGPTMRPPLDAPPGRGPSTWTGALNPVAGGAGGSSLPLAAPGPAGLDTDALANTILERLTEITSPAATPPQLVTPTLTPAAPAMGGGSVQRAPEGGPDTALAMAPTEPEAVPGESEEGSMKRPSDADLSNLSRWLYPLIRYRLRGELREDRERAGLLTDHYRRW